MLSCTSCQEWSGARSL
ncbi:hypothetical protein CICLE_v100287891mg, partial [Citrus x clementina]